MIEQHLNCLLLANDGVVLATENKGSILTENEFKTEKISEHIGCVYSGMGPDFRYVTIQLLLFMFELILLVRRARKIAMEYELAYGEEIPVIQLVTKIAIVMQEYTQSGGVRPFGVSLLIAGWDKLKNRPLLFQSDPSGAYFAWKATALGKNDLSAKTFLEKRFTDSIELDDGIHTALLTLRESFDVAMTEENVELAICTKDGFRRLTKQQLKDHINML
ncbi:Proteasome subunit alpha type [Aphelenchoides besseyi]|nr:Proteasome subunit alpha type [Aphelenchoides besseyi]